MSLHSACVHIVHVDVLVPTSKLMASQPASNSKVFEFTSFVRGLHAYKDIWDPRIGEVLALKREPENSTDKWAVAVVRSDLVVGHVPYEIAATISHFLKRDFNKGTVEITGTRINRGAGLGLGVPCTYRLYGPAAYIQKAQEVIESSTTEPSTSDKK